MNLKTLYPKQLLNLYRGLYIKYYPYLYVPQEFCDETTKRNKIFMKKIKVELDTRGHILNKKETKLLRQKNAKKNKGGRKSHKKK